MPEACQFLEWDSRFFDLRIARVLDHRLNEASLQAVLEWCKQNDIDCLYFLADAADQISISQAEHTGFSFVDVRMTLARTLQDYSPQQDSPGNVVIRSWQPADLPALQAIAATGFSATRFYADSRFPAKTVDSLYQTWITKSCHGYAQAVLVALPAGNPQADPCGFITAHLEPPDLAHPGTSGRTGSIGLLGIDAAARGQGVGQALLESSLIWFSAQGADHVSVVTQGRNIAAQRLYQRGGFLTQAVQLWYHLWFK